ncbi:5-formyltetrahydrofolate cyclo-ligase [Gracilibacillus sp. S3-1-1]|uniref:5-formyltetrahydrofolate cyclo-ligase n=1 Tax=Gracilibacillus pellucidus TaxID=3095368 RepID=A0ACC6M4U4_9BACI|nr:5-formyltetrahydrofolate cyclo-ligase [Gracilibacillus sp. S3-1-1]MDX8045985.1 5-formyltetrahydrofolate cyclo-ligase [Gracilibacillus sp. S3-1-1]
MNKKTTQRNEVISHWQELENREQLEEKLQQRLFDLAEWKEANVIATTIAKGVEWNTEQIIYHAWQEGKKVAIPKSNPIDHTMKFYLYSEDDQLEKVWKDILEPIEASSTYISEDGIDLLIVPGIVFNKQGFRIGFGGGFYDRFLKGYTGVTVSLVANFQLMKNMLIEEHDQSVDILLTNFGKVYCKHT